MSLFAPYALFLSEPVFSYIGLCFLPVRIGQPWRRTRAHRLLWARAPTRLVIVPLYRPGSSRVGPALCPQSKAVNSNRACTMAPDASTSVHNEETSVGNSDYEPYGSYLRKSCYTEYVFAHRVYEALDSGLLRPRNQQLERCRSNAWFARNIHTSEVRIVSNACHLRWCPVCAGFRKNFIGHSVSEWLRDLRYPKFLTLTFKHRDWPLSEQLDALYRYFRLLRKRREFLEIVSGGIWFFQIKKSKRDHLWHPHIHCLIDGKFLPHKLLKEMWLEITTESHIVDIRPVKDPDGAALECSRYAARPATLSPLSLDSAIELVQSLHGKRTCGSWGIGRCVSLKPPKVTNKSDWVNVGSWQVVFNLRRCNPQASAIFYAWSNNKPLDPGISLSRIDACLDDYESVDFSGLELDKIYDLRGRSP